MATSLSLSLGAWRSVCLEPRLSCISTQRVRCFSAKAADSSFKRFLSMGEQRASVKFFAAAKNAEISTSTKGSVVSSDWLHQHLHQPHLKVLDASWYMPAEQRNPLKEFTECHIPGALFFDIDGIVDDSSDLPHMLPSKEAFAAAVSALGLHNADSVVVYDGKGIFSAARAWWMFRVFGHENVFVLDGGLPKWRASEYPLETTTSESVLSKIQGVSEAVKRKIDGATFDTSFEKNLVWSLEQVRRNVEEKEFQLVDARSKARFDGAAAEPRTGVRAGHVPGSKSLPFNEVLSSDGLLLPSSVIEAKFKNAGLSLEAPIVASCGTGVTACILALALHQLGIPVVPVYDGSWTEWGGHPDTPVARAGPWGWPVIGHLFSVTRPLHRHFATLASRYGPIVFVNMGSRPTVVISSPEWAREVFKEHDIQFASRPRYSTTFKYISHNFSDLVFAPYGGRWRYLRRICSTELFTVSKVNMFRGIRTTELHAFAEEITMRASKGEVNLSVAFQELLTNLMSSVLFGKKFYNADAPSMAEAKAYRATWGMLTQESGKLYIGDFIPALRWIDYLKGKDYRIRTTVMPALRALLNSVVEERRNTKQETENAPRDFMDVMLALNKRNNLNNDEIIAIIQDMLLAGTGTTRATLEWGFTELVRHPRVQAKAQEELDRVVGRDRYVEEADLKNLPYIQALVKEIMRLHPAAPFGLPHSNPQAVKLAGYTIPPNSTLHVNIWAICRDPNAWEKAEEFMPERFLDSDHNLLGQHFDLIPFSSGRRRCAGIPLALLHVTMALAYLLHRFEWEPPVGMKCEDIDMAETTGLACVRTYPLLVTAKPRLLAL